MQSLSAYGITFTSFTTEIHPSFYILIPILVLALLMALLAPFCVLFARGRAFARVSFLTGVVGWVVGEAAITGTTEQLRRWEVAGSPPRTEPDR